PRNDSVGGTHPKHWDANHARPPRHTLASAMFFLRCHCEEGVSLTRQSSDRIGIAPHRHGIPHYGPDWIATSVLFETFLAMTAWYRCAGNTGPLTTPDDHSTPPQRPGIPREPVNERATPI
ncbi:MAG: hypothetical protein O3B25_07350, partial [Verrucomicrobia bacterium]|nr:hypothetical protein [Verrucomicrobiota bacterium]